MRRAQDPTRGDRRRFDKLLWGPGGFYDDYRDRRWEGSVAGLHHTKYHSFSSSGHRWGLAFSIWTFSKELQATVSLYPEPLLSPKETPRVEETGFYDHFAAFFGLMGYERGWVTPRGNVQYTRLLSSMSEVGPLLGQFLELNLGEETCHTASKATSKHPFRELLEWAKRRRRKGWRISLAECSKHCGESLGGVRWKIRKDLLVTPTNSCTWFFAWPPKSFGRRDWKQLEKVGFFERSARDLQALGQKGYWRPRLFTDPDRLAAEFWKPEHDPRVSRKDFEALLNWELPKR